MADFDDRILRSRADVGSADVDQGLRSYMLGIYNYMALGVALTGIVAFAVSQSPALLQTIHGTSLRWVFMLSPLAFVLVMSFGVNRLSSGALQAIFWAYAAVMGAWLSYILVAYTGTSVARVFFITSAAFAGLSLYGYTTKTNLSAMGSFLIMGVIGLLIALVVNIFLQSSALQFAISVIGVGVFAGLTAYDTQRLKNTYFEVSGHAEMMAKASIMGALSLYLNFINMFIFLMNLMGERD